MKKVIVIGCPGSGKSTFSRALGERTALPIFHLDMLYWNADKTTVPEEVFLRRLSEAMAGDEWIIDGDYSSTLELRMAASDTVFFLDLPTEVCLNGVRQRRGTVRTDMPWVENGEDAEFMEFIANYNKVKRHVVMELLEKYSDKNIFVLKSREQAEAFLVGL